MIKKDYNILIADRNPHVRQFLKREMLNEGYNVCLADSAQKILKWLYHNEAIDLLILDPEIPDATDPALMNHLQSYYPNLKVIVHAFLPDKQRLPMFLQKARFVEKTGSSIEQISHLAVNILEKEAPCALKRSFT